MVVVECPGTVTAVFFISAVELEFAVSVPGTGGAVAECFPGQAT